MTESQWYEVSYSLFTRLFRFRQKDANRTRIQLALKLEARKIKFIYPSSKQENFGETTNIFSFYAYLNRLFRRTVTRRKGDETKILTYNKNILVVMTPNTNEFEFSIFYFICEEIKPSVQLLLPGPGRGGRRRCRQGAIKWGARQRFYPARRGMPCAPRAVAVVDLPAPRRLSDELNDHDLDELLACSRSCRPH
jgi:hypothetical protein